MIGVLLLTYNRLDYAKRTLDALGRNLRTDEKLWLHIADDGSSQEYRDDLFRFGHEMFGENVSMSNSERRGYGANYNLATQAVHKTCEFVLPIEDDWELSEPFDLTPIVDILRDGIFGCVRMGYIGSTQDLLGKFVSHGGLWWLELLASSPEPHVFAGHPRLETVEWERAVGPWPEGRDPGETEFSVCHIKKARQKVGWPIDLIKPSDNLFAHIGTVRARDEVLA